MRDICGPDKMSRDPQRMEEEQCLITDSTRETILCRLKSAWTGQKRNM